MAHAFNPSIQELVSGQCPKQSNHLEKKNLNHLDKLCDFFWFIMIIIVKQITSTNSGAKSLKTDFSMEIFKLLFQTLAFYGNLTPDFS